MIPKKVTLQNFLSYGPETVIEFTADEPLWVVSGPNGVGKSAVFDAITYCLFAEHRGGGRGHDHLIRHGANGFSVSFEFEFAGTDYRVSRNRVGKRATQSVESWRNETWVRVPDVDSAPDVDKWVEHTLGLPFAAFTASVLLRQGKADDILDAQPAQRLDTLKKIIGVERYELLSKRVETARKGKVAALEYAIRQRAAISEVTAEELATAEAELARTATAREAAEVASREATVAVPLAQQWVALCGKRDDLARRLSEAATRAADASAIRADHARFVELSAVVPVLQKLFPIRASLEGTARRQADAVDRHTQLRGEFEEARQRAEGLRLQVTTLRQGAADLAAETGTLTAEQKRQNGFLALADDIAQLRQSAASFPVTLDADTVAARETASRESTAERAASAAVSENSALLKQAKQEQASFDRVEEGITCSRCGQVVTAEHADKERERLASRVADLSAKWEEARATATTANSSRLAAEARLADLTACTIDRDRVVQRLADRERDLAALGGTADAETIRGELARLGTQLADLQRRHAEARDRQQAAEADLGQLAPTVGRLEVDVRQAETDASRLAAVLAGDTATRDSLLAQLPAAWHAVTDLAPHAADRDRLAGEGIVQRFRDLELDATRCEEWARQLSEVEHELAAIPEAGRVPVADAERQSRMAQDTFRTCDLEHRTATTRRDELLRRRDELTKRGAAVTAAETDARIHGKLDHLLGKHKLQRELIREAESHIVRLADQTLGKLSGGELSLSLSQSEEGDDKAFDLLVHRSDDPQPIGVKYLSGSQKFRVAISVALAIGRFASGQARPLESVIIDEGFGSLDKDGLRAAAEELNRLKDHLRRIVLVSHQEEFTDQFPVVIRLRKGENGTTAEQVRQRQ